MNSKRLKDMRMGFTLIEILVTILIVAILASFAYVQYTKSVYNQALTDAISQVQAIAAANQTYYQDNYVTPSAGPCYDGSDAWASSFPCLVNNHYLASQASGSANWSNNDYSFTAGNSAQQTIADAQPHGGASTGVCIDENGKLYEYASSSSCPIGGHNNSLATAPSPGPAAPAAMGAGDFAP